MYMNRNYVETYMHITKVKMIPLHPTNAPETTNALLESIKPAALVENPDREFRNEIDTGMSPPPIAMTAIIPYKLARTATMTMKVIPNPRSFQV